VRRLYSLLCNLPFEATTWARIRASEQAPAPEKPKPAKVDYDAIRALGGNVVTIPRAG
jgi:hypothetical protein